MNAREAAALDRLSRENRRLRETVAALDARLDSARREIAWWHDHHGACERARQLIDRGAS